jgi:hypothetical protein
MGSQRMGGGGGGGICLKKTAAPLSLMTTFRMSLLSAGLISMDSTFKLYITDAIKKDRSSLTRRNFSLRQGWSAADYRI